VPKDKEDIVPTLKKLIFRRYIEINRKSETWKVDVR
jgi:hypothetical protein